MCIYCNKCVNFKKYKIVKIELMKKNYNFIILFKVVGL
jgi:hypothetical protein